MSTDLIHLFGIRLGNSIVFISIFNSLHSFKFQSINEAIQFDWTTLATYAFHGISMHCSQLFQMHKQIELTRSLYWRQFFFCCRIIVIMETTIVNASILQKIILQQLTIHSKIDLFYPFFVQTEPIKLMVAYGFCSFVRSFGLVFFLHPIVLFCWFVDFWNRFKFLVGLIWRHTKPNTKHDTWMENTIHMPTNEFWTREKKVDSHCNCTLQLDDA